MPKRKKLPEIDLEELRSLLKNRREELLRKSQQHNIAVQTDLKGDLVDQSTDLSEREIMLGMVESDRIKIREIQEALEQIDNNSYGICESCNEPIPIKRLTALPTARFCVPCQEKNERTK